MRLEGILNPNYTNSHIIGAIDLEWKIREISHELSTVLHKLKKEKELPKSTYSVVLPKSFGRESEDPTKRDQTKAYVSVLREVNYIFRYNSTFIVIELSEKIIMNFLE